MFLFLFTLALSAQNEDDTEKKVDITVLHAFKKFYGSIRYFFACLHNSLSKAFKPIYPPFVHFISTIFSFIYKIFYILFSEIWTAIKYWQMAFIQLIKGSSRKNRVSNPEPTAAPTQTTTTTQPQENIENLNQEAPVNSISETTEVSHEQRTEFTQTEINDQTENFEFKPEITPQLNGTPIPGSSIELDYDAPPQTSTPAPEIQSESNDHAAQQDAEPSTPESNNNNNNFEFILTNEEQPSTQQVFPDEEANIESNETEDQIHENQAPEPNAPTPTPELEMTNTDNNVHNHQDL